jgi:hypothetical protein
MITVENMKKIEEEKQQKKEDVKQRAVKALAFFFPKAIPQQIDLLHSHGIYIVEKNG